MTIAYFDTIGGISGDMTLGAFVQAGVQIDFLRQELNKLPVSGYSLNRTTLERSSIAAEKVDVIIERAGTKNGPHSVQHRGVSHHHTNALPIKDLRSILGLIGGSSLPPHVQERAAKIFTVIGEAEARIHNKRIEEIHFHEIGAIDSIVDIVGACICLEYFGVERVYSSPVKLGCGGFVDSDHGKLPVPSPATLEILKDYPAVLTEVPAELTTPTGAGIIKALSSGTLAMEELRVRAIGYGCGTRDIPEIPNVLRVFIGELSTKHEEDELVSVETNIDNMNPEIYPYVIDRLLAAGAHDAYLIPVVMKKGRPGILLSALANRGKVDSILKIVFAETTTLGVRIQAVERRKLQRASRTVKTSFGEMRMKVIVIDGTERLSPEFEECKRVALAKNMPLVDVYKQIESEMFS